MRYRLLGALLLLSLPFGSFSQTAAGYDKALADSLGADEYGMKVYILVILKTGSGKVDDRQRRDSLFTAHFENIVRLVSLGKLVVSGPIAKNDKQYEGIFILNVKTPETAAQLLDTDPAIKAKLLEADLYKWYGSAALPAYLPFVDRVAKKHF